MCITIILPRCTIRDWMKVTTMTTALIVGVGRNMTTGRAYLVVTRVSALWGENASVRIHHGEKNFSYIVWAHGEKRFAIRFGDSMTPYKIRRHYTGCERETTGNGP
jgi:hypothetical protein